ncbi:helix-turn-helix transcriptional regulator [Kitasatospora purpeofusca]|uniref:helix-turn-helix transcriptional regulator n=1 Tax=Kitasatospora purpeofusca TaxID=67352 RepID=UPI0037F223C7
MDVPYDRVLRQESGAQADVLLTPREASPIVRVTPKTLANWRSRGIGPAYTKLSEGRGGRVRYRLGDLHRYLADRRVDAA